MHCPICNDKVDNLKSHKEQYHEALDTYDDIDKFDIVEETQFDEIYPKEEADEAAGDGTCPFCNIQVSDLYEHIQKEHPDNFDPLINDESTESYENDTPHYKATEQGGVCPLCGADTSDLYKHMQKEHPHNFDPMTDSVEVIASSDKEEAEELDNYEPKEHQSQKDWDKDLGDMKKQFGESWDRKSQNNKVMLFEHLGFTQGDSMIMAELDWSNLSTEVRKAIEVEEKEKEDKRKDSTDAFNDEGDQPDTQIEEEDAVDYNIIGESLTNRSKYECEWCNSGFKSNESLMTHHNDIHVRANEFSIEVPWNCPFCMEDLGENETMKDHLAYNHGIAANSGLEEPAIEGGKNEIGADQVDSPFDVGQPEVKAPIGLGNLGAGGYIQEGGAGSGPQGGTSNLPEQAAMSNIKPDYDAFSKDEGDPYESPMTEAIAEEEVPLKNSIGTTVDKRGMLKNPDGLFATRDTYDDYLATHGINETVANEEVEYTGGDVCATCGTPFEDRGECKKCNENDLIKPLEEIEAEENGYPTEQGSDEEKEGQYYVDTFNEDEYNNEEIWDEVTNIAEDDDSTVEELSTGEDQTDQYLDGYKLEGDNLVSENLKKKIKVIEVYSPTQIMGTEEFKEEDHPRDNDGKFGSGGGSSTDGSDNKHSKTSTKDLIKSIKGGSKDWHDWGRTGNTEDAYAEIERRNREVPRPTGKFDNSIFRDDPDAVAKMENKIKVLEDRQEYWKQITKFPSRDYHNRKQLGDMKWYEAGNLSANLRDAKKKLVGIKTQQERGTTLTRKPTYPDNKKRFYYSEEPKEE